MPLRADQPGGENNVLHTRRSQQSCHPDVVRHRQAIAESAADGDAKAGVCGAYAKVAATGNRETAASAHSGNRAIVGSRDFSKAVRTRSIRDS